MADPVLYATRLKLDAAREENDRLEREVLYQWVRLHAHECGCEHPDEAGCGWPVPIDCSDRDYKAAFAALRSADRGVPCPKCGNRPFACICYGGE